MWYLNISCKLTTTTKRNTFRFIYVYRSKRKKNTPLSLLMWNKSGVNLCQVLSTAALVLMQTTPPDVFKADARSHCVHKSMAIAQCRRTSAFQLQEEKWAFRLLLWCWCSSIKPETTAPFKSSQMLSRMWKSHFNTKSVCLGCLFAAWQSGCYPTAFPFAITITASDLPQHLAEKIEERERKEEERGERGKRERRSRIILFRHVWCLSLVKNNTSTEKHVKPTGSEEMAFIPLM